MRQEQKLKLLYIMSVDWNWIFQRPQIIALHLEELYDVTVVFPRGVHFMLNEKSPRFPKDYRILRIIPFQERITLIGQVSSLFNRYVFKDVYAYDAVWIGYPLYYRYIPQDYQGKIIYDCMDNHVAMFPLKRKIPRLIDLEESLVKRSDRIFVSSLGLQRNVFRILGKESSKVTLLRNGSDMGVQAPPSRARVRSFYKIGYFGTIAEWFDFGALTESLEKYSSIEYHLIGPVSGCEIPKHDRICVEGVIGHEKLAEATKDYDCLCMPFLINEIVRNVDPVKLYEYISMGKCIISVRYKEIERFADYVYLYGNREEYLALLEKLMREGFPPKYTFAQQKAFLKRNSWSQRFETLDSVMALLLQNRKEDFRYEEKGNECIWHQT